LGRKQRLSERGGAIDHPGKRTTARAILERESAKTGNLPKKLVINSQNPQPYSFLKLPLFIEGYFKSQLKTLLNIHY